MYSRTLSLHHSQKIACYEVKFTMKREDGKVVFHITVTSSNSWNTNNDFSQTHPEKNSGLWNYDVVEVFVQPDRMNVQSYYEFQVSPLSQPFSLKVIKPRVESVKSDLDFSYEVSLSEEKWESFIEFKDLYPEKPLYGGVFACLGKASRQYYAIHPNPEAHADFHRPEFFIEF